MGRPRDETCDHAGEVNLYRPYGFNACEVCSETCELHQIVQRCGDGIRAEQEVCDMGTRSWSAVSTTAQSPARSVTSAVSSP